MLLELLTMNLKIFLAIVFILNLVQGICTPVIDDEAYYWMWSLRLDAGYFDHPPMIATWIKLSDLFFDGEIGLRFITIIMNTISALLMWKILSPKTKNQINTFLVVYFSLIFVQIFSWVSTPDAPLLFFTIFYLYSLKRFIKDSSIINTALLSIGFAGLMYSKYHGILVLIFTLIPILSSLYKKPSFYLAILISLVLYGPHFYWLYENDFPPLSYHFIDRSAEQKFSWTQPFIYIVTALFGATGLLVYYTLKSIRVVDRSDAFKRSVFWLAIGPFFFFLFSTLKDTTQAQWLLISYIACGLLLYWSYSDVQKTKSWMITGGLTIGLIFIVRVIIMIPSLSPLYETKNFGELAGNLVTEDIVAFEKYQEASIFQFYNRNKRGVVYRTLGNRNSQFSLWDDERLLNKSFNYVTPWSQSLVSFEGLKGKEYFVNKIENYHPIHQMKGEVIKIDSYEITDKIEVIKNAHHQVEIKLSEIDWDLIQYQNYRLEFFITKEQQYNIVEVLPIELNVESIVKDEISLKSNFKTILEKGTYSLYIGITPPSLISKYVSKPLKMIVTE